MSRDEKARVASWMTIVIAAVAVLIASVTLAVGQHQDSGQDKELKAQAAAVKYQSDCNAAFLTLFKDAQQARIPFSEAQSRALTTAFGSIPDLIGGDPTPQQIQDLLDASEMVVTQGGDYQKAVKKNPYPDVICPDVPGITTPKVQKK